MTALLTYIEAWVANDAERIAGSVAEDCTITECYGPVYRGRARVQQWAQAWFTAGGMVHAWEVTDRFTSGDREAAQWVFECTWGGKRSTFQGASICRVQRGQVVELREYQTTAPLYEWSGAWR